MRGKTVRIMAGILLLLLLTMGGLPIWAKESGVETITLLSVNDFHGALVEAGKNPGMAKLGKFLKEEKAKNPEGTLILSAGDMFQGTMDSNLLYGQTVVEGLNQIGFDAFAVGNHEFDWGLDKLRNRIDQGKFPYLGANVLEKKTGKTVSFLKPYTLIEKKGIKIGIIGLVTPETAYKANPKVVGGFEFADPILTVNRLLPELKKKGAEIIVVLSHLGSNMDPATGEIVGEGAVVAQKVKGIDALITAHTHQKVMGKIKGIPVLQAGHNGRGVGKILLLYSKPAKQVVNSTVSVVELPTPGLTPDPALEELIWTSQAKIAPIKSLILGKTVGDLTHNRYQISLLGQWSADVLRQGAQADIAFQNGGGLRTSIPAGKITLGQLYEVMPFDNFLYTVNLTGAQIMQILQHGIKNEKIGMVQFSGLKVQYDSSLPLPQAILAVTTGDGTPLDLKRTYKVATNDFMAAGGDGFTVFQEGKNGVDTGLLIRNLLIEAVKKEKIINYSGDDRFKEIQGTVKPQKDAA